MKLRYSNDGLHYFDRKSGINILLDEVLVPSGKLSFAPRFVSFALTNLCDLHCPFCYAPKIPALLDFDHIVKWSHELDENGALGVGFGGGEPTLYPRFSELCKTLAMTTELGVSFTTHAHRFSLQLRNALEGFVHFIRVSMDGIGRTYEQIRNRSFNQFTEQLKIVSDTSPFGINYVVNDATIHDLDQAAEFVFSAGAREMLLLPEQSAIGMSHSTQSSLVKWIAAHSAQYRLASSATGITDGMPIANPFQEEEATMAYVHVNASGRVSRTSYDQQNAVAIPAIGGILTAIANYRGEIA